MQAGDGRALEELYRRYAPLLLRYFYRMLWQDQNKAQDAVQDIFVKIIERPDRVDADRKFSTWIYAVAHNFCKNEYRRHLFRQSAMNGHKPEQTIPSHDGISIDHEAFLKKLEGILQEEGEDMRTMMVLRHELEMSFPEIASIVELPEGTVKSRLFYLKKRLASALEPYRIIIEK